MNWFVRIITLAFAAIFLENSIFVRGLGTSTMLIASKNDRHLAAFSICITFFSSVSSLLSYFVDIKLLNSESSRLYLPLIYVMVIGLVYILTLLILWRFFNGTFLNLKKFIHLSAFNCAVLGALLINSRSCETLLEYLVFGLGIGIGFSIAAYFLSIVYERVYSEDIPDSFRGFPIIMIYIGILSMAFYGFIGHQITF